MRYPARMVQALPAGYVLDPADPRAPTHEQWVAMTPAERTRVIDMLPTSLPLEMQPPEGDVHRTVKQSALSALDDFFRRAGRRIYLSSELLVMYPGEPSFAPDLLAVLDVDPHPRTRWVVDAEDGRGIDLVIEVHVSGDRAKDEKHNVQRFAKLGIPEYFFFDRARLSLAGYRLLPGSKTYQRLVPQVGRFGSEVLGLDLAVANGKLRFFAGNAPLEEADERIARLGSMLDEVVEHKEVLARQLAESEEGREEAERKLAEALAEIERLRGR
jgi:Uma2 family endonuclease